LLPNIQAMHPTQQILHLTVLILLLEVHGLHLDSGRRGVALGAMVMRMVAILSVMVGMIATRVAFAGVIRVALIVQLLVAMGIVFVAVIPAMRIVVALVVVVPSTAMGVGGSSVIMARVRVWVRIRIRIIPFLIIIIESLLNGTVELSIGEVISCSFKNVFELVGSIMWVVRAHGKDPARQDFSVLTVEALEELSIARLI